VIFENERAPDPRSVLMFGDSFAEYRPGLLTAMLAETFWRMHFVWSSSVDYAIVDRAHADLVVTVLAERFHPVVPSDDLDLADYVESILKGEAAGH
jgi:hypothetical protein